jgi:hypothetical protein
MPYAHEATCHASSPAAPAAGVLNANLKAPNSPISTGLPWWPRESLRSSASGSNGMHPG